MPSRELRQQIGSLFMVGFDGRGFAGDLKMLVERYHVRGVIFFARNVSDPVQVWELNRTLLAKGVLTAVDHEGGRVHRFPPPVTHFPAAARLAESRWPDQVRQVYRGMGEELSAMGFQMNFAPTLDVLTHPDNRVIGDRSFSSDPHVVAEMGAAAVKGLHEAGMLACGKHFPGHGACFEDSHQDLPVLTDPKSVLDQRDIVPFRATLRVGLHCVMPGHLLVREVDDRRPASLSPVIVDGWLRKELGFRGIVVTDDLEMKGVSIGFDVEDRTLMAIEAGGDLLLYCTSPDLQLAALETVYRAVDGRIIKPERIQASAERVRRLKNEGIRCQPARNPTELKDILAASPRKLLAMAVGAEAG